MTMYIYIYIHIYRERNLLYKLAKINRADTIPRRCADPNSYEYLMEILMQDLEEDELFFDATEILVGAKKTQLQQLQ